MSKEKTDFPDKYMKKIDPAFVDTVGAMDAEEIKQRILTCEGHIYEIENAKDADEKLTAARESVKEFSKDYRESKAIETAKIKYCLFTLEGRGVVV